MQQIRRNPSDSPGRRTAILRARNWTRSRKNGLVHRGRFSPKLSKKYEAFLAAGIYLQGPLDQFVVVVFVVLDNYEKYL